MIPDVTKTGRSFKGAFLYYLHDKNAMTDDRIEFTHTVNLATDNPDLAWKMMSFTFQHQNDIKRAAGTSLAGKKHTDPVYAYSLSWTDVENPTKEEMIAAGLESLKILDLTNNEVVIVAHNDTDNPHIHLIVNKVDLDTGIAAKVFKDHYRLQEWGEEYDRQRGNSFCPNRTKNIERRRNGDYERDRGNNLSKAEFHRWLREHSKEAFEQREKDTKHLSKIHRKQRKELLQTKRKDIDQQRKKQKEHHRPQWSLIYKQQDNDRQALKKAQHHTWTRLTYYLKNRNQFRRQPGELQPQRGLLSGSFNAIMNGKRLSDELDKKQKQERAAVGRLIKEHTAQALKQINKDYTRHFDHLKNMQHDERHLMKTRHTDQSKEAAANLTTGKTEKEYYRNEILRQFEDAKKHIKQKDIYREYAENYLQKKFNKGRDKGLYRDYWNNVLEEQKAIERQKTEKREDRYKAFDKTAEELSRDRVQEERLQGHAEKRDDFDKTGEDITRDKPAERETRRTEFTETKEDITNDKEEDREKTDEDREDHKGESKDKPKRRFFRKDEDRDKGGLSR